FLVNESVARLALRTAGTYLPLDREDRPYQWSTTTYCDTYDWQVLNAERAGGHATQLRLREYHRTRPNQVFASESLFLEMKDDSPDAGTKERYVVPTAEVPAYLRGECTIDAPGNVLVGRVAKLVNTGVRPVVVTQYNRIAHSAPDGSVRITADHNLMYLAIPWEANTDDAVPSRLGPVLSREPGVIIEVKWFDKLLHWADELYSYVREHMVNERPSKFVIAMQHLLGETERSA
ncbi:MAG: VTC domain-containing protein, partial [Chloroflexota bacterium]|nr:VTC domain-containing protein [Chloroflexota bacterium]